MMENSTLIFLEVAIDGLIDRLSCIQLTIAPHLLSGGFVIFFPVTLQNSSLPRSFLFARAMPLVPIGSSFFTLSFLFLFPTVTLFLPL